jgi:DNA (cytosine-5)-methyltransferase 1
MKYNILNAYACLGGNRFLWDEIDGLKVSVTAVENDPELARLYQLRFPNDLVIVADAHQYILDHYKEFDFIWSSPPCPTHSRARVSSKHLESFTPAYPEMSLYQQAIFLGSHFSGKYCIENVIPYYEPLIAAQLRGRHLYWSNFKLPNILSERKQPLISDSIDEVAKLSVFHQYDFYQYKGSQRRDKIARNLVDFEAGKTILQTAFNLSNQKQLIQQTLFNN